MTIEQLAEIAANNLVDLSAEESALRAELADCESNPIAAGEYDGSAADMREAGISDATAYHRAVAAEKARLIREHLEG